MYALCKLCRMCNARCMGMGLFALAVSLSVMGCLGSGVSYNDKRLIVAKNDAVLSCGDTVIGGERQVDAIVLKKDGAGLVRTVYFKVSKDSSLSISEENFRLDFIRGFVHKCG